MAGAVTVTLSWQTITLVGGVLTALGIIAGYLARAVRFVDRQKAQDAEIESLKQHHEQDKNELYDRVNAEMSAVYEELTLLTYGIQACLKGLHEQGCNGPVTEAVHTFDKHLNKKAHEHGGVHR